MSIENERKLVGNNKHRALPQHWQVWRSAWCRSEWLLFLASGERHHYRHALEIYNTLIHVPDPCPFCFDDETGFRATTVIR
jgi:hypothetical protein